MNRILMSKGWCKGYSGHGKESEQSLLLEDKQYNWRGKKGDWNAESRGSLNWDEAEKISWGKPI